ncbi:hsp90 co-chaperone Cdc37 [Thelotrema lepadinum]|nr:hsp90 co-chaperone Cdc37 [Thelotrema lepadinum]
MPVDYSKWDALELSDDSDFEPHPNVDKKSFIRAKQNQIHMQRAERKHQIETLKYERVINNGLLRRIDTLLAELRGHEADAKDRNAFLFQAMIASAGDPDEDEVPKPPAGVHSKDEQPLKYSQMMGSLVDQAKKEVDSSGIDDWYHGYIKAVEGHKKKVNGLQKELEAKLAELEKEETRKITSEHIRDGFNSSAVTKEKPKTESDKLVEVLNPKSLKKDPLNRQDSNISSGAEADVDENLSSLQGKGSESEKIGVGEDDENVEATELGKEFAKIKMKDYPASLRFIIEHREILAERETDGLLMLGFDAQLNEDPSFAKQCVHQALLIQYCRSLGRDGVQLFFKRITTPGHEAYKVFIDDVNATYEKMRARTIEIAAERAANPGHEEQVEQIQLQAMEPGTEIRFNIPLPGSEDEIEIQARAVFESFPPGLQRALESGSLDRVNEVLAKMSVEEAEEVVGQLGDFGMLDMREGVIDGTTEEGQEELKKMQAEHEKPRVEEIFEDGDEDIGEPGEVVVANPD